MNLPFFQKFLFDSLCSQKCIFLSIFRGWSIKYRKMCLLGHFSDKIGLFLFFLGHPVKVNLVGTNFSIHSQTNGTHFVLWTLLKNSQESLGVTPKVTHIKLNMHNPHIPPYVNDNIDKQNKLWLSIYYFYFDEKYLIRYLQYLPPI